MDGFNSYRAQRVADVLADFRTLQYYISGVSTEPANMNDYWTEGWAALRQCALDGQQILNFAADTNVPQASGGAEEQEKAELKQVLLDAIARRHESKKIYLRQAAAQRWVENRYAILQGQQPDSSHKEQLDSCDHKLQVELMAITDEIIYSQLRSSDESRGRWTAEDPSLHSIQHWIRTRS